MPNIEELIQSKQYDLALRHINDKLSKLPKDAGLYLQRSVVQTRQSQFDAALSDAEHAAKLSNNSPESQLRKAVNLWRLDRKHEAQALVSQFDNSPEAQTWRAIISQPLSNNLADNQPTNNESANNQSANNESTLAQTKTQAGKETTRPQLRTDWYQSSAQVNLSLYCKNVDPQTQIEFSPTQVRIDGPDLQYTQDVNAIDPVQSTYSITPYKIELVLQKQSPKSWKSLTELADSSRPAPTPAPVPNVQYNKWDQIADSDEEAEAGDPMDFFQKLYSGADDATKRAMLKSYTESNGTALSTDWSQVSQQKVATVPPASMEAKEFK